MPNVPFEGTDPELMDDVDGPDSAGGALSEMLGSEFSTAAASAWRSYFPGGDTSGGDLLNPKEEQALARRIAAGDASARAELIAANYRLVFHVVSRFRHAGVPLEDLIQEGNLGLIEAADRFDPARGCRFNTYAMLWIRGAVMRAVSRLRAVMPIPERTAQQAARLRREEEALAQELLRHPSTDELGDRVGLSAEQVEEAGRVFQVHSSLEALDADSGRSLDEWLLPSDDPSPSDLLTRSELAQAVNASLVHLTPREREVVRLRYGLDTDEPRSLAEVGRVLSISRQRARELEQSALRRLRALPPQGAMLEAAGD